MLTPCNPLPLKPNATPSIPQSQILPPCNPLPLKPNSTASIPQNQFPPSEVFDLPSHDFPSLPSNPNPNQAPPPPPPTTNPWSNPPALQPRPPRKFNLRFIPPAPRGDLMAGVCSPEAVAAELKVLDNTLVGFVMGKRPSFSLVKQSLLKQWKISGSVDILQLIQGGFGFRFSKVEDRDYICEIGVFYVGGLPIFLRPWERSIHSGGVLGLRRVPLWITLPGLPLHLWGEDSLSAICSVLGNPLFTDGTTAMKSRWVFARVCVEFSGDTPLLDSVLVEDDMGTQFKQVMKYEWKPPQCLTCGVFGHEEGSCLERDSGDTQGVRHTAQEDSDILHSAGKKIADGNNPFLAAGKNLEEVGGDTLQKDPPRAEDIRLKDKSSFSFMLQNRSWKNLNGKFPNRVRKKSPMELDPTRNFGSLNSHRLQTDLCPENGHMSCLEGFSDGPATISADRCDRISPAPQFRKGFSKSPFPLLPTPTLSNRFRLLENEKDLLPSDSSALPDVSCPSPLDHSNVSIPEASLPQPPDPTPTPPHPLARKSGYRDQSCFCGDPTSLEPFLLGSTPTTPSVDPNLLGPGSSSIGRTPYHARSDAEDEDDEDEDGIDKDEDEHNVEEEDDQLGRENEDEVAAKRKKLIGDDPEPLIEPIPYFNSADDKAEDIEEEVNEEDVGTEEDVDEDYEVEKEKDNQLERVDAVEETARRKKLSNSGRYDDLWVTTTDLNDPRRINFW